MNIINCNILYTDKQHVSHNCAPTKHSVQPLLKLQVVSGNPLLNNITTPVNPLNWTVEFFKFLVLDIQ